ncbi:DUF2285 domain-containing protein [Novosphingobium sp. G106]|uniref:transcriptional regulator domain-containing protein n=1 Tax=Novosphingobium sp. G106 TaxID=2849500 RepID=UPI001C2D9F63|nr:DUF2285 domain-containing protein [Novosphingobium sp. G106]MBV1691400.1 DUF2285 domain-containing protein [Novosphingobium sp. G106]
MDAGAPLADWRSGQDYAALAQGDRRTFAWEWLRRSAAYCQACQEACQSGSAAAGFGLHRLEPATGDISAARPVWRAQVDPHVAVAAAIPGTDDNDTFDFARLAAFAKCVGGPGGAEHWLWSSGARQIRLDVVAGTLHAGPVRLDYRLSGFGSALPAMAAIARLIALARTGSFAAGLFPTERRAHRWALVLRTHDALVAGASQREIAEHLFGLGKLPRWRIEAPSWRQRAQRLVVAARQAAGIEPYRWLDGTWP